MNLLMIRPLTMCGDLMRIAALTGILVMFGILGAQAAEKRVAAEEPDGSLSAGFAEVGCGELLVETALTLLTSLK